MSYFTGKSFSPGQVDSSDFNEITSLLRLASDSVDGSTITLTAGVLSAGVFSASNYGALSVGTAALAELAVTAGKLAADSVTTAKILDLNVTGAKIAETTIAWSKTLTADRATQADIQSGTASHFVPPDVLKYIPGVAKAYGRVSFANGSATITGGFNVSGGTDLGLSRRITLTNAMADTNYTVVANCNETGAPVNWTISSATQFILEGPGTEASGREISFAVYGTLA